MHNIYIIRGKFLKTQWLFISLCSFLVFFAGMQGSPTILLLMCLWNTISYTYIFIKELKYSNDLHPILILEATNIMFIGISGLSNYGDYLSFNELRISDYVYTNSIGIGTLLVSLGTLMVVTIFYYFDKKWRRDATYNINLKNLIDQSKIPYIKYGVVTYTLVWISRLVNIFFPLDSVANVLALFVSRGHILALLFIVFAMTRNPKDKKNSNLHWIIVVVEFVLALHSGMKETILQILIPYFIYIFLSINKLSRRTKKNIALRLAVIGFFAVIFVFPYVSIFRTVAIDKGKEWEDVSVGIVLDEYGKYISNPAAYDSGREGKGRGAETAISRAGAIGLNTVGIDYAIEYGPQYGYLYYCGVALIPRIVWPNKPTIVLGGQIDNVFRGESIYESVEMGGNSMTFGVVGSSYFAMGLYGMITMIILVSIVLSFMWKEIKPRIHYSIIALWVFMTLLQIILKNFESLYDCGFNFVVMGLIYILILKIVSPLNKKRIVRI